MADISFSNPLHNPSMTLNPSFGGSLGYFGMSILAGIIFPIWGHISLSDQIIKGIWNIQQLKIISNQMEIEKQKLKDLEDQSAEFARKIAHLKVGESNQESTDKLAAAEEMIQELLFNLTCLKEKEVNLNFEIEDNKQKFIAAVLGLIPFLGVLAAGIYFKAKAAGIQETGIHGCAEALAQHSVKGFETLIQSLFYPLSNKNSPIRADFENSGDIEFGQNQFEASDAEEVQVPVKRGRIEGSLSAYLVPNGETRTFDLNKPVMVCFHGNAMTKETSFSHAKFYKNLGFNVVAVTMGGYPGSGDDVLTSEISSYQDANAIISYLKQEGFTDIGIHGLSIGGTLAFAAAELHPDVVKFVVADQTLGSGKNVGANLLRNKLGGMLPEALIRGGIGGAFQVGLAVPGVQDSNGEPYVTDGLNNIRKVNVLRERAERGEAECHVFAFKSKHDFFMGRINTDQGYVENFADDLIMARYGALDDNLLELNGGHGASFMNSHDIKELKDALEKVFFSKEPSE